MAEKTRKSGTTPITRDELTERIRTAQCHAADMRAAHSESILAGGEIGTGDIERADRELSALQSALEEFDRREEERAAQEALALSMVTEEERRQQICEKITSLESQRLTAIQSMETHARALVGAFENAERARKELAPLLTLETGIRSLALSGREQENRLSSHLSSVLARATGNGRFGQTRLHPGGAAPDQSWIIGERYVAQEISRAIKLLKPADTEEVLA